MSATKEQIDTVKMAVEYYSKRYGDNKPANGLRAILSALESAERERDKAERETAALRGLVRRMRIAGNMVRDAMPNSVSVHNWIDVCAEADKVLGETTP